MLAILIGAKCSSFAYLSDVDAKKAFRKMGHKHLMFFSGNSTQVFVTLDIKTGIVYISFRGTELEGPEDVLTDLNFNFVDFMGKNVHEGFLLGLNEVLNEINATLIKHGLENAKIKVCGHSLGGALSVLCGNALLANFKYNVIEVVTFGQPRIGDKSFSKFSSSILGKKHTRVVNDEDIVPTLPPEVHFNFVHSGTVIQIDNKGSLNFSSENQIFLDKLEDYLKDAAEAISRDQKGAFKSMTKAKLKEAVVDHKMENYLKQIQAAYNNSKQRPEA